jgi:hypothetical protein
VSAAVAPAKKLSAVRRLGNERSLYMTASSAQKYAARPAYDGPPNRPALVSANECRENTALIQSIGLRVNMLVIEENRDFAGRARTELNCRHLSRLLR